MSLSKHFDIHDKLRTFGLVCVVVLVGLVIYHAIFTRPKPKELQRLYTIVECLEIQLIEEALKREREKNRTYDAWEDF